MFKITIQNHNLELQGNPAISLLNIFAQQKAPIHTVCGGRGNCGCCRIKILEGSQFLSKPTKQECHRLGDDLLAAGWRLSCQTHAIRDITVFMPLDDDLDLPCRHRSKEE
jgi:ferredoxin